MTYKGAKLTLCALVAATGVLARNAYLDLSPPFPECAIGAATLAVLSTTCHDETLLCVCTDGYFTDAFTSAASDFCDDFADVIQATKIIQSQCSTAGYFVPTSTDFATATGSGWWPPYATDSSFIPSWTGSSHPHPTESYISWITTTLPCSSDIEASTTSVIATPITQSTAGTTTSKETSSTPTTLPTTNGAKRHVENTFVNSGFVVAMLGAVVLI